MRFLADENVPGPLMEALRDHGHDVRWVRTDSPGSADPELLAQAQREDRTLLTFDKDFGSLVFLERLPALLAVVLLRIEHLPIAGSLPWCWKLSTRTRPAGGGLWSSRRTASGLHRYQADGPGQGRSIPAERW